MFDMKRLRKPEGMKKMDRIRNKGFMKWCTKQRICMERVDQNIHECFGHMESMSEGNLTDMMHKI